MSSEIKAVGVVGAGQMGIGIAHVCAVAGYDVCVTDISQDILDQAKTQIENGLGQPLLLECRPDPPCQVHLATLQFVLALPNTQQLQAARLEPTLPESVQQIEPITFHKAVLPLRPQAPAAPHRSHRTLHSGASRSVWP